MVKSGCLRILVLILLESLADRLMLEQDWLDRIPLLLALLLHLHLFKVWPYSSWVRVLALLQDRCGVVVHIRLAIRNHLDSILWHLYAHLARSYGRFHIDL